MLVSGDNFQPPKKSTSGVSVADAQPPKKSTRGVSVADVQPPKKSTHGVSVADAQAVKKSGQVRKKNQEVILKAAEMEFLKHGFEGASIKRIAEQADIPRANVHYYYKNKEAIYSDILSRILALWDAAVIETSDDPYTVLSEYIKAKVQYAKTNPEASRIFASEMIHGAPRLQEYLATDFKTWTDKVSAIIQGWIDQGKMDPINPLYLLFCIWGSTQHYADFGIQVKAAMGKKTLSNRDFDQISTTLVQLILKGCGIIK